MKRERNNHRIKSASLEKMQSPQLFSLFSHLLLITKIYNRKYLSKSLLEHLKKTAQ